MRERCNAVYFFIRWQNQQTPNSANLWLVLPLHSLFLYAFLNLSQIVVGRQRETAVFSLMSRVSFLRLHLPGRRLGYGDTWDVMLEVFPFLWLALEKQCLQSVLCLRCSYPHHRIEHWIQILHKEFKSSAAPSDLLLSVSLVLAFVTLETHICVESSDTLHGIF